MAGQDIVKRLQPGQSQPVQVGGDFIFLKFADRPIVFIINGGEGGGSRVTMEAGDKYRPGGFDSFEIENPDPDTPVQLVMTVGRGDFNRQIITGEITAAPGVRKTDGRFAEDSRYTIQTNITPAYGKPVVASQYGAIVGASVNLEEIPLGINSYYRNMFYHGGQVHVFGAGFENDSNSPVIVSFDDNLNVTSTRKVAQNLSSIDRATVAAMIEGSDTVFFSTDKNQRKIFIKPDDNQDRTVIATMDEDIINMWGRGDGLLVMTEIVGSVNRFDGVELIHMTATGEITKRQELTGVEWSDADYWQTWAVNYNSITDQLHIIATDKITLINPDSGAIISHKNGWLNASATPYYKVRAAIQLGDHVYVLNYSDSLVQKFVFTESKITLAGVASRASCGAGLFRPDQEGTSTGANVTVKYEAGRTRISGEVIKAALEMFFGEKVIGDYLDHVYSVTIYNTGSEAVLQSKGGNSVTLARLGIKDSFTAILPGRIDIVLDSTLTTEKRL